MDEPTMMGHVLLRWSHIAAGTLSLVAGFTAMALRKGAARHELAGRVFVVAMVLMSGTGAAIAVWSVPNRGNVMGGLLTLYLTVTAWAAAWRPAGRVGRVEYAAALLGLATAMAGYTFGVMAGDTSRGTLDGYPAMFYFLFGSFALIGTLLDARMLARGGFTGAARTTRHLTRISLAMFMATMSFFIGQSRHLPAAVRETRLNLVPVLLVIGALLYWVVRIRVLPLIRRRRRAVVPA